MDLSPLQQPDGVTPASALECLACRLVAVHQKRVSAPHGPEEDDCVDLPLFSESEFGLDDPVPSAPLGFLDRVRRFFDG